MYAVCELKVRTSLRCVSASGHSHAVSMWAWPIAEISWTCEPFRLARSAVRIASASSQVERSSSTQTLQKRLSSERSSPGPRLVEPAARRRPRAGGGRRSRGAGPTPGGRSGRSGSGRARPARATRRAAGARRTCRCRPARRAGRAARRRPPARGRARRPGRPPGSSSGPGPGARRSRASPRCGSPTARSTRSPAHSSGTVASTRNQYVAHSGPNRSPSAASRYSSSLGLLGPRSRSTGPATRSESGSRTSAWIKSRILLADLGDPIARVPGVALHGSRNPRWLMVERLRARCARAPARPASTRRRRPPPGSTTAAAGSDDRRGRLGQALGDQRAAVGGDRELGRRRRERGDRALPEQHVEDADHDRPARPKREPGRDAAVRQRRERDARDRPRQRRQVGRRPSG